MPPEQSWATRFKRWIVGWVHSAMNYLNRKEVVELQQVRIDRFMSSQEKKARTLLWANRPRSTGPKCDSPKDSLRRERNKPGPYPYPSNSVRSNLRRRHSCSKISRPSSLNPESREWLPYLEKGYSQG